MALNYYKLACDLWLLIAVIWVVGMFTGKAVARTQPLSSRVLELGLCLLGFALVFSQYCRSGWIAHRFLPESNLAEMIGLALTLVGVVFAISARLQLGGNWSAAVTAKHGHTLIRRGPYKIVRHPIYSGFLLATFGVALIVGEYRALLGLGVLFLGLWIKSSIEERFMLNQFNGEYRQYQRSVRALIPFIF